MNYNFWFTVCVFSPYIDFLSPEAISLLQMKKLIMCKAVQTYAQDKIM